MWRDRINVLDKKRNRILQAVELTVLKSSIRVENLQPVKESICFLIQELLWK